jgi:tetratricopeptide (TPR) repeat protein/predicted aspartyl protease
MRTRPILLTLVATLAAGAADAAAAADPAKCELIKAATLPVTMVGTRPMVTIKVNGQDARFLADSGAFFSSMTPDAAARLGLKLSMAPLGLQVRGVGGQVHVDLGTAKDVEIDGIPLHNMQFLVGDTRAGVEGGVGLLGQNVLGFADAEYDLANGMIRLIVPKGACQKAVPAYWAGDKPIGMVDVEPLSPAAPHFYGKAKVNGETIRVMFDTGASTSVMKLPVARRLGFRPDADNVRAAGLGGGVGKRMMESWIAPFDNMDLGGESIRNTRWRVADIELHDADMLIGADFFLSHRVYVSRKQHRLYFTYNGGPVFRLDEPRQRQAQAEAPPAAAPGEPSAAPVAGETPTDAAGFSRRGAAYAARRDFPHALADFRRAIELEPKAARHYDDRAMAHLASGQPVLAMSDFAAALQMKPDDERALMGRGQLFLASRDVTRAVADFDAAAGAAPADSAIRLAIGSILARAGQFERAIAQYDAWIGAHPQDGRLAQALNGRCWTRALWGQQLDTALADCDAAIKRGARVANLFDSRGLVKLRLGQLDGAIADYDQSLKLQPKGAWSLYGRGLAKLKKGDKAGGQADMAAGLALQPSLRAEVRRAGLDPAAASAGGN